MKQNDLIGAVGLRCFRCGKLLGIVSPPSNVEIKCSRCGEYNVLMIKNEKNMATKEIKCPICNNFFILTFNE